MILHVSSFFDGMDGGSQAKIEYTRDGVVMTWRLLRGGMEPPRSEGNATVLCWVVDG